MTPRKRAWESIDGEPIPPSELPESMRGITVTKVLVDATLPKRKSGKPSRMHRPIPPHAEVTTPEVAPSAPRDDATLHAERTVSPRPKGTRAHRPRPTEETR